METNPTAMHRRRELTTDPLMVEDPISFAEHGSRVAINVTPERLEGFFRSSGPGFHRNRASSCCNLDSCDEAGQPLQVPGSITPGLLRNLRRAALDKVRRRVNDLGVSSG